MRAIIYILILIPCLALSQEGFFKYIDYGPGGTNNISLKTDRIERINVLEDGFIYEIATISDSANVVTHKFVKISRNFEEIWTTEFNGFDKIGTDNFSFSFSRSTQKNIIQGDTMFVLNRAFLNNEEGSAFLALNIITGEIIKLNFIEETINDAINTEFFLEINDSTFLFTATERVTNNKVKPILGFLDRSGNLRKKIRLESIYNDDFTVIKSIKLREDGLINILYYKWDNIAQSGLGGWFYIGVIDLVGNLLNVYQSNERITAGTNALELEYNEDNRLVVTIVDTVVINPSQVHTGPTPKIYWFDNNIELQKDTLFENLSLQNLPSYFKSDTILYVNNVAEFSNGSKYILLTKETPLNIDDNSLEIELIKLTQNGVIEWRKNYHPFATENQQNLILPTQIVEDFDGGLVVVGQISILNIERRRSAFIMKLDSNGCYNTNCDSPYLFTSIHEPETISFQSLAKISPNPTANIINIEPTENIRYSVRVFDINGKNLIYENRLLGRQQFHIDRYPPGVYFVEMVQERRRFTKQIIKQ